MSKERLEIKPRYIVDSHGKKVAVILDIATFECMLENLENLYFGLQAKQVLKQAEFIDFDKANQTILTKKE